MTLERQKELQKMMMAACRGTTLGDDNPFVATKPRGFNQGAFMMTKAQLQSIRDFIEAEKEKSPEFAARVALKEKTEDKCLTYLSEAALEYVLTAGQMISPDKVFEWVKEYYNTDGLDVDKEPVKPEPKASKESKKTTKTPLESLLPTGSESKSESSAITIEDVQSKDTTAIEEVTQSTDVKEKVTTTDKTTEPKVTSIAGGLEQVSLF